MQWFKCTTCIPCYFLHSWLILSQQVMNGFLLYSVVFELKKQFSNWSTLRKNLLSTFPILKNTHMVRGLENVTIKKFSSNFFLLGALWWCIQINDSILCSCFWESYCTKFSTFWLILFFSLGKTQNWVKLLSPTRPSSTSTTKYEMKVSNSGTF
jgi:hypothetical protein